MVSFIRFRVRRKVDLPQPEGPMKAVTLLAVNVQVECRAAPGTFRRRNSDPSARSFGTPGMSAALASSGARLRFVDGIVDSL